MRHQDKYIYAALPITVALFFVGTTLTGAIRWFSPVPYLDMWDGYLGFYIAVSKGNWDQFFAQANEHRIVFSKVLFWLDIRYFGGQSRLLIAANLALMTALWTAFAYLTRRLIGGLPGLITAALLAIPVFSWMQAENITWGYQSQFFAAYLFPLIALIALARSMDGANRVGWFAISLAFGVACYGSMGNGVIAMPAMIVAAILSRRATRMQQIILFATTILCTCLWFHGYEAPTREHGSLRSFVIFLLSFLGSPIGVPTQNNWVACFAGLLFISASICLFVRWWRTMDRDQMTLVGIVFLAYIGATAFGAAMGRSVGTGEVGDFSNRYTTPALLGWAMLFVLTVSVYRSHARPILLVLSLLLPTMFVRPQMPFSDAYADEQYKQRWQAALALDLGVRDNDATLSIYPTDPPFFLKRLWTIADLAKRENLSIFSNSYFYEVRSMMGNPVSATKLTTCQGNIDAIGPVKTDSLYSKVTGWAFDEKNSHTPRAVFFVSNGIVIGAAFTGYLRPDVAGALSSKPRYTGFMGYVLNTKMAQVRIMCQA
ncbi:conserved membrane hypothetical protein [Paraburkholderia sabiae]|uniref:hypothetical protein n=1 Tax=Paraburkholderia sabiae TaxID=273251 RepID=UPI001CABB09B|nr:hypothetical protein [Paraburkholderia sabiae]CAG9213112.1 conserved membrane hypothetical protein [Paraburkholderia sabiae]